MALIFKEEGYQIVGAALEVHKHLGHGFLEPVYQDALALEFKARSIPYEKEKPLSISYKDNVLEKYYQADFFCFGKIIVELKALARLTGDHEAQVLNYLKSTNAKLGILINFGQPSLVFKRLVL